ncbi:N-acetyl-gamma-glutamyl-phosphate reductase [candidate division MSBL1 archaeon SCGC-AAA259I14]|uniref:N-acetyl-gamma-glutamyl-phosphate reductase n=1 Tax=candidate division MSBL1 archaeon SCGC-AAA259I14 TaxID=1698268 RepID=A0A133UTB5_9EURY|nr:N-acetyl-gamma-glutamyl-phosphate reductase [candidate division MSBL1 archaeon SCGC-AAA259I14]
MTFKISIVGASGYTGGELLRILKNHAEVEIIGVYGKTSTGKKITELHPHLTDLLDLTIKKPDYEKIGEKSDLVFTATPHATAMEFVPKILEFGAKVVDLSADYRLENVEIFEEYYTKHSSPEVESVYGLPELYRDEIKHANLVANPGCYPTAGILSLAPALTEGLVKRDPIIIDSKSGTSGAGAKPSEKLHHPVCAENLRAYNVTIHRHGPEIKQEVEKLAGGKVNTCFTPHLIPIIRGILNTTHTFLREPIDQGEVISRYRSFYKDEPFVRVLDKLPQTSAVRGSNFCDIGIRTSEKNNRMTIISVIDNLVKGASGQAVQNMNLMLSLNEEKGLKQVPLRP